MSDLYNLSLSNLKNIKPEMKEKIEVKKKIYTRHGQKKKIHGETLIIKRYQLLHHLH